MTETKRIRRHEPSRMLWTGIAHAARRLAEARTRDDIFRAAFALDDALFPGGTPLEYVIPNDDRLRVNLNGTYVLDARFFLPKGLGFHASFIRGLNLRLARRCKAWIEEQGVHVADRKELHAYDGMTLGLKETTRAELTAAADAIQDYFLGIHVGAARP